MYYIEWTIRWYQKFPLQNSRKNYALVEMMYLLIRFNKTTFFPWNTKNTDRNDINKQNTNAHTKYSEKDNTRMDYATKSWLSVLCKQAHPENNDALGCFINILVHLFNLLQIFPSPNFKHQKIVRYCKFVQYKNVSYQRVLSVCETKPSLD